MMASMYRFKDGEIKEFLRKKKVELSKALWFIQISFKFRVDIQEHAHPYSGSIADRSLSFPVLLSPRRVHLFNQWRRIFRKLSLWTVFMSFLILLPAGSPIRPFQSPQWTTFALRNCWTFQFELCQHTIWGGKFIPFWSELRSGTDTLLSHLSPYLSRTLYLAFMTHRVDLCWNYRAQQTPIFINASECWPDFASSPSRLGDQEKAEWSE